jgi:hypothetical protein
MVNMIPATKENDLRLISSPPACGYYRENYSYFCTLLIKSIGRVKLRVQLAALIRPQ